jgi:hypothetical protein
MFFKLFVSSEVVSYDLLPGAKPWTSQEDDKN